MKLTRRARIVHGTPITPAKLLPQLKGSSFCVSFEDPRQINECIELVGQDEVLMLDNGAFTAWKQNRPVTDWSPFFAWCNEVQSCCDQAIAVIPDVINGTEAQNLELISLAVRYGALDYPERAMPVWHMNESFEQLIKLCRLFNFVAWGSCQEYDITKPGAWEERARHAMAVVDYVELRYGNRPWLHMMRGLGRLHDTGFDSADSTNIARNHCRTKGQEQHVAKFAARLEEKIHGPTSVRGKQAIADAAELDAIADYLATHHAA